jgi:hypothetical protein
MAKVSGALLGAAGALAALAFASASQQDEQSATVLRTLSWVFAVGSVATFVLSFLFALAYAIRLVWRYFHAVELPDSQWYCRYWPHEEIAQVTSVGIETHDWTGAVDLTCCAQVGDDEVTFTLGLRGHDDGRHSLSFEQTRAKPAIEPLEGDPVDVEIVARPRWW